MCLAAFSNSESTCTQSHTSYSRQNKAYMIKKSLLFAVNTFQLRKEKKKGGTDKGNTMTYPRIVL